MPCHWFSQARQQRGALRARWRCPARNTIALKSGKSALVRCCMSVNFFLPQLSSSHETQAPPWLAMAIGVSAEVAFKLKKKLPAASETSHLVRAFMLPPQRGTDVMQAPTMTGEPLKNRCQCQNGHGGSSSRYPFYQHRDRICRVWKSRKGCKQHGGFDAESHAAGREWFVLAGCKISWDRSVAR